MSITTDDMVFILLPSDLDAEKYAEAFIVNKKKMLFFVIGDMQNVNGKKQQIYFDRIIMTLPSNLKRWYNKYAIIISFDDIFLGYYKEYGTEKAMDLQNALVHHARRIKW